MQLYPIEDPGKRSRDYMQQASSSYSRMGQNTKQETEGPGKTAGGGMMAGMGGAGGGAMAAGAAGAAAGSPGMWWGMAGGFCVGLAAYYLS